MINDDFKDYFDEEELDDDLSNDFESMYMIIGLGDVSYGIKLTYVSKIGLLPKVTPVPDSKPYISGVIMDRNNSLPLIDTRLLLGLPSLYEGDKELIIMLKQREQDHLKWTNELIASVNENREFKLTTDPHACAFGRWYDNFRTDNLGLADYIRQFDKPHKQIHKLGIEIRGLVEQGLSKQAIQRIEQVRLNELNEMLTLFRNIDGVLHESHRELSVIINTKGNQFAIKADNVDKIISIEDAQIQPNTDKSSKYIKNIANIDGKVILMLDLEEITL
jgi:purine-binding chemotaxis protein CheW